MKVPTVGSVVKVRAKFHQGPSMIPTQAAFTVFEGKILPSYKWLTDREFCMSGDKDFPIRVISMNAIEDIQLLSGELKEVNTDNEVFIVDGSKGNKYTVTRSKAKWTCTCPGFGFRGQCKHISELSK